jgi:hypothetical protein
MNQRILIAVMFLLSMMTGLCAGSSGSDNGFLNWNALPDLPDSVGVAGPFVGISDDALIVAGGANFPDSPPWQGGQKIWYDEIHVLEKNTDGNLWDILDDLVEAGIDLFHPVEPLAGMDPAQVHRRYPDLILCGTIDVSQLLPFGTAQEITDQVVRNIEATEGRIMVGSSTEINNEVPLKNYLALHETVLGYSY